MNPSHKSEWFDEYYYRHDCGEQPYQRDEGWLNFFDSIAEKIYRQIGPKTILDAGCAMGFLVEGLRKRNIEAYGVDISSYAIKNVHPSIKPYVWEGSITIPFPMQYDLITCIEVLEHMPPVEAEMAIKNICEHTDDIIFSSTPFDYKEVTHINVRQPEYWAEKFAEYGFYRDLDFDASFVTPWAVRFRKKSLSVNEIIRNYEKHFFLIKKENYDLRVLASDNKDLLGKWEKSIEDLNQNNELLQIQIDRLTEEYDNLVELYSTAKVTNTSLEAENQKLLELYNVKNTELETIRNTETWKLMMAFGRIRQKVAPSSSYRGKVLDYSLSPIKKMIKKNVSKKQPKKQTPLSIINRASALIKEQGLKNILKKSRDTVRLNGLTGLLRKIEATATSSSVNLVFLEKSLGSSIEGKYFIKINEIRRQQRIDPHNKSIDIIVCVHNALSDTQKCLENIILNSTKPYRLIIINDGSDENTTNYLKSLTNNHPDFVLIENSSALGYTKAANQGIKISNADFVILINSDTIVPPEWLDRMAYVFSLNPRIGVVGPISNTASWQSVPNLFENNDWAQNPLPEGLSIEEMGKLVSKYSPQIYPSVPLLNGFCLMIRKAVIADIGILDEINFPTGYGEEDDFVLRARKAGWQLAWADDVYVYHAQSRSFSHERRKILTEKGLENLRIKHGLSIINESSGFSKNSIVLNGIRIYNANLHERDVFIKQGHEHFSGKRILFLLPVAFAGGGANVIIDEARSMIEMGVDVRIFNLEQNRMSFINSYPDIDIPVTFGELRDITNLATLFDAIVATVYFTVEWLQMLAVPQNQPKILYGYYIQDFEPLFFSKDSNNYLRALKSYKLIPDVIHFTKTEWTAEEVFTNSGVKPAIVGITVNTNLFRPRHEKNGQFIRIAAMIRPSTPYREPEKTLLILKEISKIYGKRVEILLFGVELNDPEFNKLPLDFEWKSAGTLNQKQVANLLSMSDVFVDFSSHQAMGLTALEAMSCGCCVLVPENGGAKEFVQHGINGFVVNTNSIEECINQLETIIDDPHLRYSIQMEATKTVNHYIPEKSAYNILKILFGN